MYYKLKRIIYYVVIKKMMDYMWFQSLWAWYVSWSSKYDKERYKNAFLYQERAGIIDIVFCDVSQAGLY